MVIHLVYDLAAEPKRRHRSTRSGRVFDDPKNVVYCRTIQMLTKSQYRGPLLAGMLSVSMHFYFKEPKKPSRSYPSKSDLTNLAKAIEDAFNGLIWKDDDQVAGMNLVKAWGTKDRIMVSVAEI